MSLNVNDIPLFLLQTNHDVQNITDTTGTTEWYQSTLKETCVQNALNNYLGNFSYLDGYNPSQTDAKVYQALVGLNVDIKSYPHLYRWYKHIASYSKQEQSVFRAEQGKILLQCACKVHNNCNNRKQVRYIQVEIEMNFINMRICFEGQLCILFFISHPMLKQTLIYGCSLV